MRKRITWVLAVAGLAPLVLATPASAAPGNGVERYSFTECSSEDPGEDPFEICAIVQGHRKVTETGSGHLNVTDHSTIDVTLTSEDRTRSGTVRQKHKLLVKQGREQVAHDRVRFSETINGITCNGSTRLMIVKGEVKKELRFESCDGS